MDEFARLRELLKDDTLASVGQNYVTLVERNNHGYTLRITGIPHDTIAFKTDEFPPPKRVFKNSRHECKRADYVMIARKGRRHWIVYIEMKRTKGVKSEIVCQLRGAKCVVAYCRAIIQEFWDDHQFLQGYAERFVSIGNIGINKQPTREPPAPIHNNPDDMRKLPAPRGVVQFRRLLK